MRPRSLFIHATCALLGLSISLMPLAYAQERISLPDLGSSARASLPQHKAAQYGASMLHQMRGMHMVLDDALVSNYLNDLGYRLVAHSEDPKLEFTFFVVKDNEINAFAAPGGYIGVNAGLIGLTHTEGELAAVMSHEIGHITQHHLERAFESAKRDSPLAALVILGAIAAGASGNSARPYGYNGTSEPADPSMGILAAGMGLLQQRQINFTRHDEIEADRAGIKTMTAAGFDSLDMANFFQRMQDKYGSGNVPELLQTHPVTVNRIAQAKSYAGNQRAQQAHIKVPPISKEQWQKMTAPSRYGIRLSTPSTDKNIAATSQAKPKGSKYYALMRERVRALSLQPDRAIAYYQSLGHRNDAENYGYALALVRYDKVQMAHAVLSPLAKRNPSSIPVQIALAESLSQDGQAQKATRIYTKLNEHAPRNKAIITSWAHSLLREPTKANGQQAAHLIADVITNSQDPTLYHLYARASKMAGDSFNAAEASANASYLNGRPFDAMEQLQRILKDPDLDYYQRARIQSDIDELHPLLLELKKHHVETADRPRSH